VLPRKKWDTSSRQRCTYLPWVLHIYVGIHIHIRICVRICGCKCINTYMYTYTNIMLNQPHMSCTYTCTYVKVHIHMHIHIQFFPLDLFLFPLFNAGATLNLLFETNLPHCPERTYQFCQRILKIPFCFPDIFLFFSSCVFSEIG